MALENPLPPRPFRDQPSVRRSIRSSGDGFQFTGDGLEREDAFRSSTRIDMKQIVSAGKMSISPSSRDVVMASRAGLFIVDLENPLNVPAFLPQGGMLEMADVQWNPHANWSEYILSTSGEKLLVWNLKLETNRHIQHTLETHYRAITDINWHTADPSRIATCAMDAWLWLWDLRSPIQATSSLRPTMGLSAFNESATQVKWNYYNPNILASAHNNEILIWDERKGSMPLKVIRAHDSKIYGINWSRLTENEITTCSLDRTIKKWDVSADGNDVQPLETIQTDYPVWRAKNLPFGKGLLSLPHRGRHTLEMYAYGQTDAPVHTFEGFSDVVTEFVWRVRGGQTDNGDNREFQLITWDRDSVLQFWPIDTSIMQKVGYTPNREKTASRSNHVPGLSYRDQLEAQANPISAITAPTHQSGVLKSVKATKSRRHPTTTEPASLPVGSSSPVDHFKKPQQSITQGHKYGNMTMGKGHGRAARPHLDPLTWYSAVEEDTRRSESVDTSSPTRKSSSRASGSLSRRGRRSARSGSLAPDHEAEQEAPRSLKEEITQAAAKFTSSKLKIVDVNLGAGTRKCTVEMHGLPSLFIRILFTFPDDYPGGKPPNIDIDHIRKIAPRKQANMLRELRLICAQNTHSIEPCIRFLLGLPSQGGGQKPFTLESDSEEDIQVDEVDMKTGGAPKIQQNQPPRERTAQAVFSKNGALVRIVMTDRKQPGSPTRRDAGISGKTTHLGDLPLALHGLAQMAKEIPVMADGDPNAEATSYNFADSFSTQPGVKHTGILGLMWNRGMPFKPRPRGKATIIIEKYPGVNPDDFDPILATKFIYTSTDPIVFCTENAVAAARHGRHDYRRLLESLTALLKGYGSFSSLWSDEFGTENEGGFTQSNPMSKGIKRIYQNLVARRNLQMLAMFAIAILLSERSYLAKGHKMQPPALTPALSEGQRTRFSSNTDYFSLRPRNVPMTRTTTLVTTPTPLLTPPEIETPPAASTPPQHSSFGTIASKAGAFSSVLYPLFFTGTSEGSDASQKNRGSDPPTPSSNEPPEPIPIPQRSGFLRSNARPTRPRRGKSDASVPTPTPTGSGPSNSGLSVSGSLGRLGVPAKPARKATSVFVPTPGSVHKPTITFALVGQPKRHLTSSIPQERWKREGKPPVPLTTVSLHEESSDRSVSEMPGTIRSQLITHIRFYGELLYRAGLLEARLEVLAITNAAPLELEVNVLDRNHLAIHHLCRICSTLEVEGNGHFCQKCNKGFLHPACTYCRLPVRGLSRTCLSCNHTTHLKCWALRKSKNCATGCGCECPENATFNVKTASLNVPSFSPTSPIAYQRYAL